MEAIFNFWNYLKAFLMVRIGVVSNAIDHRMARSSTANIDESKFYLNSQKDDEDDYRYRPGFYLSRAEAAANGCLFKIINMDRDDDLGFYH